MPLHAGIGADGLWARVSFDRRSGSFSVCCQQPIHVREKMLQPSEMKGPCATWHERAPPRKSFAVVRGGTT